MDKIFKIGLLVLGFSYLAYLFCPVANQVGRYSFQITNKSVSVLDTTNADIYSLPHDKDRWEKLNPRTGKARPVDIDSTPKKTNK